jgi:hypothetical protein
VTVLGGHAGRHAALDPHVAADVVVLYWLSGDVSDDLGGLAHRDRLRAGERVCGASMSILVGQSLGGYCGDVLGVDEGLRAVGRSYRDNGVDGLEEGFADTRPEGCVALLLAWIVSLVDVNQILRPHAM